MGFEWNHFIVQPLLDMHYYHQINYLQAIVNPIFSILITELWQLIKKTK